MSSLPSPRRLASSTCTHAIAGLALLVGAAGCQGNADDGSTTSDDIVGGDAERRFAAVGYLAFDWTPEPTTFSRFCTATLIAPRVVVTAAHCVREAKTYVKPEGPWITFARGAATAKDRKAYVATHIYEDPGFRPDDPAYFEKKLYANDIALVVLEEPMTGTRPAKIAEADKSHSFLAVGYGRTETGPQNLEEQGDPQRKSLPMSIAEGSPAPFYEATPQGGSSCYGDSGGPLLDVEKPSSITTTVGVVSWTENDGAVMCVPGSRTFYVSLAAKRAFIDAVVAQHGGY